MWIMALDSEVASDHAAHLGLRFDMHGPVGKNHAVAKAARLAMAGQTSM